MGMELKQVEGIQSSQDFQELRYLYGTISNKHGITTINIYILLHMSGDKSTLKLSRLHQDTATKCS